MHASRTKRAALWHKHNQFTGKEGSGTQTITYREYIDAKRDIWKGKKVMFEGSTYTVVDVDYNGMLLIDKKARFTDTTAVESYMVQEV